jgi:hypothetical protein
MASLFCAFVEVGGESIAPGIAATLSRLPPDIQQGHFTGFAITGLLRLCSLSSCIGDYGAAFQGDSLYKYVSYGKAVIEKHGEANTEYNQ